MTDDEAEALRQELILAVTDLLRRPLLRSLIQGRTRDVLQGIRAYLPAAPRDVLMALNSYIVKRDSTETEE